MSDETKQDHTVELAGVELEALRSGGFKDTKSEATVEPEPAPEPEAQEDQTSTIDRNSLRLLRESQKLRELGEARGRDLDEPTAAAEDDHDETRAIDRGALAQMLESTPKASAPSPFGIIKKKKKARRPKKDDSPTKERAKPVFSLPDMPTPAAPLVPPAFEGLVSEAESEVESEAEFELEELVDHVVTPHVEDAPALELPEPPVGLGVSDAASDASEDSGASDLSLLEQVSQISQVSDASEEVALDDVPVEVPAQEVGSKSSVSIEEEYASEAGPIVTTAPLPELGDEPEPAPTREPTLEMELGSVIADAQEKKGADKGVVIAVVLLGLIGLGILGVVVFLLMGQ